MTDETLKERIAEILRDHTTWSPQAGAYVIHGAIEKIVELFPKTKTDQEIENEAKRRFPYSESESFNVGQLSRRQAFIQGTKFNRL